MCARLNTRKWTALLIVINIAITVCVMFGDSLGIRKAEAVLGYENRLFDTSRVHDIEILMDSWQDFLKECEDEVYVEASVIIDGERLDHVAIRAKGNTSLLNVRSLGSQRYSLKIEFDRFQKGRTYHGLDKLCLNNLIQDNTYMKDYLTYQMMNKFDAPAPLCSFVRLKADGNPFGLYLAVEGVEESFLSRNFGTIGGGLYKPDAMDPGGGNPPPAPPDMGDGFPALPPDIGGGFPPLPPGMGDGFPPAMPGMESADVMLQYVDDNPESYNNIFASAKTTISRKDQDRLIRSLKTLSTDKNPGSVLYLDKVIRFFVVHNYVVNGDSYTGGIVHNYYLYENQGRLAMIPWDYNLAFGVFQNRDPSSAVNDPMDTPLSVSMDGSRPMVEFLLREPYLSSYHQYFETFLSASCQRHERCTCFI